MPLHPGPLTQATVRATAVSLVTCLVFVALAPAVAMARFDDVFHTDLAAVSPRPGAGPSLEDLLFWSGLTAAVAWLVARRSHRGVRS